MSQEKYCLARCLLILSKGSIFAESDDMKGVETVSVLTIQGLVQGVGFRPFVYRIAKEIRLKGEVENRNNGVCVRIAATRDDRECFINRLKNECPEVAFIHHIQITEEVAETSVYTDFTITPSRSGSDEITQVAPDIAVCPECLHDREVQPHRLQYPFINCTHCGPRFSIIRDLPYDRKQTTMSLFPMCPACEKEYTGVTDRRFHAQPVACNHCGPSYYATYDNQAYADYPDLLALSVRFIASGEVIAVKGIGGYHLVCDATNEGAVTRLREIKSRDTKPFAVLFRGREELNEYVSLSQEEGACITSWRRPIVLLKQRRPLAPGINPGMLTLGCMLPYMPIHYDWFARLGISALVMTSGNLSDYPIAISPGEAEEQLRDKVPLILHHNREIYNRVDDSVLQVCGGQPCLIRRSRGFAPEPFFADIPVEGLLAFGAEKVSTFALGKGETILQSQYLGDLKNWETFHFYTESLERFRRLFRFTPRMLVCDKHPDYLSSREAERISRETCLPLLKVQHHHAHAVACMLEYGLHEPVIAFILDGTGAGDDGKVWGGEVFLCDRSGYKRLLHFDYGPMPGGDKASVEPWRMAVAYLWHYFKGNIPFPAGFVKRVGKEKIDMLLKMMEQGINTPYTSGAGRLFDAVASLLNVCDVSTHQAEAPVRLEQLASDEHSGRYPVIIKEGVLFFKPMFEEILNDLAQEVSGSIISARFHNTLSHLIVKEAKRLLLQTGASRVVISGGCFQNKRLTEQLQHLFRSAGIPLYVPGRIPCNDSGIAAGQLAVAASKYKQVK